MKPAEPPPSFDRASLEERLLWILMPPINELLNDPQLILPEKPFPYQVTGIKWLFDRKNALLADEMGLGKTMQAIIAARLLWREGLVNRILVVCPKTLIPNWHREIEMWWPEVSLNTFGVTGNRRFFLRLATPNIVFKIINYEALSREKDWVKDQQFTHDLIVLDEAQRIKNPNAGAAKAVKSLKSERRWALTGTPLENRTEDLVSIFGFVKPDLLEDKASQWLIAKKIPPFLLRRRTEEVMQDLPRKSEQDIALDLDPEHRVTYERKEREGVIGLNAKGENLTVTHVFALINQLRQICNFDPMTGSSVKLDRLLEDLEEVRDSGRKALVFSQFVHENYGLKRLASKLEKEGYNPLQLHGEIPSNGRVATINSFTNSDDKQVLLLNYAVGGLGLNLQVANYVFLFDRWWNPAVEDQAIKRAHRIGQKRPVFVRRFYCKDTIEERILLKLAEKRRLFRQVIDENRPEADSFGLSEEEIFSLFKLSVHPKKASTTTRPLSLVLDKMDPKQFENLVAQLYEAQGYRVTVTGQTNDAGIDIIAERARDGAFERVAVQCKHQLSAVGRPTLQQLWGVLSSDQRFNRGDLVTSAYFSKQAESFADGKRLLLIGRVQLSGLLQKYGIAKLIDPLAS
ncbi:MAG: SNF2-related protein [Terracidiphilus sp.]